MLVAYPNAGPWVEDWLSTPRFTRYLDEADGDRGRALAAYEWNLVLGQALMRDIAHFEVALRNAYDATIVARWDGSAHWLLDPASPAVAPLWRAYQGKQTDFNAHNRRSVAKAIARCGGPGARPAAVITELTLGFWQHMTDPAHEKSVWIPFLHHAWPRKTNREEVDRKIRRITDARNRTAHHEPMFNLPRGGTVLDVHHDIVDLLTLLLPGLALYVARTSTVAEALSRKP
jgi:hypothetical protein